jgi:serine/threonine-protein kinase
VNRSADFVQAAQPVGYRLDDLEIDIGRQRVTRGGVEIPLPGLSFDLLLTMVRAAPNLVTYDQLMERIWPGVIVNQETINQRVKLVRDALGDDPRAPRYIAGVRGRGYRALGSVVPVATSKSFAASAVAAATQHAVVPATPPIRPRWRVAMVAGGAVISVIAGTYLFRQTQWNEEVRTPPVVQPERTIAVLPFANISGDVDDEYFSDGLTEELLNRLANVQSLRVAARTSSFAFKNHTGSVKEVGTALGVRHILEGSVRRHGDRLRVTAQLVNTTDGFHLWSKTFERQVTDVFVIQDEIARAVAESLRVQLADAGDRAGAFGTTSNEAYDLYLRARHLYQSFQLERATKAISYYEAALRADPTFAAAYIGLADALSWHNYLAEQPHRPEIRKRIQTLARKALDLDPQNGDAHALLAGELMFTWDFEAAEGELRRAEALNPNGEYVLANLTAYYMLFGWPPERAIEYARRGRERDPLNPWAAIHVPQAHWHAQQYGQALRELERVSEIDPNFWLTYVWQAMTLTELGRHAEALLAARRALELHEDADTLRTLAITHARAGDLDLARAAVARLNARGIRTSPGIHAALGDHEAALAALELDYTERDRWVPEYLHYPELLPLHGEPRFQRIVRILGQERRVEQTANLALTANGG